MNRLVKFYQNPVDAETQTAIGFINKMVKKNPAMEGGINVIGNAKLVVVGVQVTFPTTRAEDAALHKHIVISMGVSRCTPQDEFSKEQGIDYAEWRANNEAQVQFKVPANTPESEIIAMFNKLADTLNKRFSHKAETQALPKLPKELLEKYAVTC